MRYSTILPLALASLVAAVPTDVHSHERRQAAALTDPDILNFALTLEHLEDTFYKQALTNFTESDFSSFEAGTYDYIKQISADESNHVSFLTTALSAAGATPVQACTYNFGNLTAKTFLATAQVLEGVGVSAYAGAAQNITNKQYLTAAAVILTTEARHSAFIRYTNGNSPFAGPYDTPLTPKDVISLAGSFIASCPSGSAPTISPFPAATLGNSTAPQIGSNITVTVANATAIAGVNPIYCGFADGVGMAFSPYSNNQCQIPSQNVTGGQVYGFITSGPSIDDGSVLAGPFILEVNGTTPGASGGAGSASSSSSASGSSSSSSSSKSGAGRLVAGSAFAGLLGVIAAFIV